MARNSTGFLSNAGFRVGRLAMLAVISVLALAACGKKAEKVASLEDVQALEEAADEAGSLAGASVYVDSWLTKRAADCFGIAPVAFAASLGVKQAEWKPVGDSTDYPGCILVRPGGGEIARIVIGEAAAVNAGEGDARASRPSSREFGALVGGAAAGGINPEAPMRSETATVDIGGVALPLPIYIGGFLPDEGKVVHTAPRGSWDGKNRIGLSVGDFFALVTFAEGTPLDAARMAVRDLVYPAVQAVHDGLSQE